jgi:hypothetical protein
MCFPWALARLLPSAVRVRIRSRSTSARPPSTASIQAAGAGAGVSPRFRQGSEFRLGLHDALDDAEQVEGAAGEGGPPTEGRRSDRGRTSSAVTRVMR